MQFQKLSIVRLRAAESPVPDSPDDDAIQKAHLTYLKSLVDAGKILVNGPVRRIDDSRFLGMSIYYVDSEEARALAMQDPGFKAGWFVPEVDVWIIPCNPVTLGDRADVEIDVSF